jgi:putative Mg2+ transporter-C (MgtC) family protein
MRAEYVSIIQHLIVALIAGGLIGYERSYSGRPAGFRTHTLVCMASALLMLITVYQDLWFHASTPDTVRLDPTRMAQGIMTGIGFLGAGVIVKEGATVRGLTTAASIWMTAAVGILAGAGFYFPVVVATALTLGTLSLFRWIEGRMPVQSYAHYTVRFPYDAPMPEAEFRELVAANGFSLTDLGYHMSGSSGYFEFRGVIKTRDKSNMRRLSDALRKHASVLEFHIAPTGD